MPRWVKKQCPICQWEKNMPGKSEQWVVYAPTAQPVCQKCLDMIKSGELNAYHIKDGQVHHSAPDQWMRHGPPDVGPL